MQIVDSIGMKIQRSSRMKWALKKPIKIVNTGSKNTWIKKAENYISAFLVCFAKVFTWNYFVRCNTLSVKYTSNRTGRHNTAVNKKNPVYPICCTILPE